MTNNRPTPDTLTGTAPRMEGQVGHGSVNWVSLSPTSGTLSA